MSKTPELFLSCDWGTSSFRLRLVAPAAQNVIAEEVSNTGIATIFNQWQKQPEGDRPSFYLSFLRQHIALLEQKAKASLSQIPLIVSGMATSSIGLLEMDYKDAPFALDGSDLVIKKLNATESFPHDVYLISGVKTDDDAMRGEETQAIGSWQNDGPEVTEQIVVLPGTHSKHVLIEGAKAVSFQTYMTGEFFDLLSQKSILSFSVEKGGDFQDEGSRESFEGGLADSGKFGLLHGCFRVRTAQLFGKRSKQQNFHYLSGLLIGVELRELMDKTGVPITVVGNGLLVSLYAEAFRLLSPGKNIRIVDGTAATVEGHVRIFKRLKGDE